MTMERGEILDTEAVASRELRTLSEIENDVNDCIAKIEESSDGVSCFPVLLSDTLTATTVDIVYDQLQERFGINPSDTELHVVLESGGGDIDASYNLAHLLRRYGNKGLKFIVPRWAKSAATLVACSGNEILMTPVAELGPLDPQITAMNPLEGRIEKFSPLHIESTLELIRNEYDNGHKELAEGLMQRLQFPLTLGNFKKSLELSKQYLEKLLTSEMLKNEPDKAKDVASRLTEGYADHGFCINIEEARTIGLVVSEVPDAILQEVWMIRKLLVEREAIESAQQQEEIMERIKNLPPAIIEQLPPGLTNSKPAI